MKNKTFLVFVFLSIITSTNAQKAIKNWQMLEKTDSLLLTPLHDISSSENDYSPIFHDGKIYFTSDRNNEHTDKSVLENNESMYFSSCEYKDSLWVVKNPEKGYGSGINTDDQSAIIGFGLDSLGPKLFTYKSFGNGDIYLSTKTKNETQWSVAQRLKYPINTDYHEQSITRYNTTIIISSDRFGGFGEHDLYVIKPNDKGIYKKIFPLDILNTEADEVDVNLSSDGKILYYSSNGPGGKGGYDIYFSTLDSNGQWQKSQPLPDPINTIGNDRSFKTYDSFYLFDSDRSGGLGKCDLYMMQIIEKNIPDTIPKVDTIPKITIDTVPVFTKVDTIPSVSRVDTVPTIIRIDTIPTIVRVDTVPSITTPIVPEYYGRIQVGAYRTCKDLNMFRYYYPSFDSTSLYIEEVWDPKGTIYKYLINQSFTDLNLAEQRRKSAVWQQGHESNNYHYTLADAFIVIFNKNNQRVMIFFSYPDKYIILNDQEYEKIKKFIMKIS